MAGRAARGFAGLALVAGSLVLASPASAQGIAPVAQPAPAAKAGKGKAAKPAPAAGEAKVDAAAAEKALENGIKSYQAGKHDAAIQSLNSAMQGGGLPSARMARGLYYRGLAYKAQGKPAQSISDLTSALWLKGGLDDKERADAVAQRATAYQEAGLGEAPAIERRVAAAPAATTAAVAAPASTGGVSGFFGNLFGGSSKPAPEAVGAAKAETATGSVSPAAATEVSSWSSEAKASKAAAAPPATRAAVPVPVPVPVPAAAAPAVAPPRTVVAAAAPQPAPVASAPAGKFRLQVAAVRTRAEADAVAAKLKREFGKKLASRDPVIDEAPVGNMGTFYRVRVGPWVDANEPRRLCISLRASHGFDCLVVTQ